MRRFSQICLTILMLAIPLALAALWIKSYYRNDYIFWRWLKVTDENGRVVDVMSRAPSEWRKHPGSKFQTRYLAIASRGGGLCFGVVLGRYVATEEHDPMLILLVLQEHRNRSRDGGRTIGIAHSLSTEYPLSEENLLLGFGWQRRLYTAPEVKAFSYREHWAVVIPHWFVFFAVSIPMLLFLRRFIRRSRWRARGCCIKCGYDLRATPGKCPECGAKSKAPGPAMAK